MVGDIIFILVWYDFEFDRKVIGWRIISVDYVDVFGGYCSYCISNMDYNGFLINLEVLRFGFGS